VRCQARVGRILDVGLDDRRVDPHGARPEALDDAAPNFAQATVANYLQVGATTEDASPNRHPVGELLTASVSG
jgi:hypothetical protein